MQHSPPTLFVIGSSTTLLFGPHLKRMTEGLYRYSRKGDDPREMSKAFRDLDAGQGASAGDSSMVRKYLQALDRAGSFHADVVLMHVGGHDIRNDPATGNNQVPLEEFRRNVEAIVEWFSRRGIRLVWLLAGPIDETLHNARSRSFHRFEKDLEEYNKAAESVLKRAAVEILDLPGFTRRLGPMAKLLKDHVHFTDDVVRLQAAFIAGYLMGAASR